MQKILDNKLQKIGITFENKSRAKTNFLIKVVEMKLGYMYKKS